METTKNNFFWWFKFNQVQVLLHNRYHPPPPCIEIPLFLCSNLSKNTLCPCVQKGLFINDVTQRGGRGVRHFETTGHTVWGISAWHRGRSFKNCPNLHDVIYECPIMASRIGITLTNKICRSDLLLGKSESFDSSSYISVKSENFWPDFCYS